MPSTYDTVSRVLVAMDPLRWTWKPASVVAPRGTSALRRRLTRLRTLASAEHAGRAMGDLAERLDLVDPIRVFRVFPAVPPLDGRHPVVLAHGPSLDALLVDLKARRDRLYVIAPLRTALRLAAAGVWADVVVLADAAAWTSDLSVQAWTTAPVDVCRELEAKATLVTQPLAPAVIHGGFQRACVFDDGLDWLSHSASLPFWGSALLPSVCLALALGAPTVAIGGMDMGASHGRPCRTWRGAPMRLDLKLQLAHGLLEALAAVWPGRFVDLSPDAVEKRGVELLNIQQLIGRPAATARTPAPVPTETICTADALRHVVAAALPFAGAVAHMTAVGSRVRDLSTSGDNGTPELARLLARMERDWAGDPTCRAILSLLQPPYLEAFWHLRAAGFAPRHPRTSVRMKARLVGPEIADLQNTYARWLAMIQEAAGRGGAAHDGCSFAQAQGA